MTMGFSGPRTEGTLSTVTVRPSGPVGKTNHRSGGTTQSSKRESPLKSTSWTQESTLLAVLSKILQSGQLFDSGKPPTRRAAHAENAFESSQSEGGKTASTPALRAPFLYKVTTAPLTFAGLLVLSPLDERVWRPPD